MTAEVQGPLTPLFLASHHTQQPLRGTMLCLPIEPPAMQRRPQHPAGAATIQAQDQAHVPACSDSSALQPQTSNAATGRTASRRRADRNSGERAEEEYGLTTSELTYLLALQNLNARTYEFLRPLINGISVAYLEVAKKLPRWKRIIAIILIMMLVLMGWGINAGAGKTISRTVLGLVGYSPSPLLTSSSSSSVWWAPSKVRSEPGDPVLQAQIQIGLLHEDINELVTWGHYPAIGSAVLVDERERKEEGKDGQDSCVAQATNDGLVLREYDYEKESVGAFEALQALAPQALGREVLDDIDGLVKELHELDNRRNDLPQIERRLEAFATALSDLSSRHRDAYTLNHLFHLRDQLRAYVDHSVNLTTSALIFTSSTLLMDQIPRMKVRLNTIEREVNMSLASSLMLRRDKFNRRFTDAACAAFLSPRNVDSHGHRRPDIALDSITDPGECLKGLVGTSQSLLHQIHGDLLKPYHTHLIKTNVAIETAGKKLTELTSASLHDHCRSKKAHVEANGRDQILGAMEQCQIARLEDQLQDSIQDIWNRIIYLPATLDDDRDFRRQLDFYWPPAWWPAWVKARPGEDPAQGGQGVQARAVRDRN